MVGEDASLIGGLILAATLLGLNWGVGFISARSRRFDEAIEGHPVLLARNGELFRDVLKQQSLSEREFERAMRDADCADLSQVELAMLETSGDITVIARS
jgi:uncharacterized membrane protein YcaP (DUF421 family)